MEFLKVRIPADHGYILPIGDVHFGSRHFGRQGREKLKGYLDWAQERDNCRVFLLGDFFDVATRLSKTSPFESRPEEVEEGIEFLTPYKNLIIGAIDGNHEARQIDLIGWSPTKIVCKLLDVKYCGWSAVVRLQVGTRPENPEWSHNTYALYFHHTTGGGNLGSSLNRMVKLAEIVEGCDVYCGGHNHQLATGVKTVYRPTMSRVEQRKITFVSCGSYLDYPNSYAEKGMYSPSKLGSPRLRFSGDRDRPDVHVSL